jgi:hypothetical protein
MRTEDPAALQEPERTLDPRRDDARALWIVGRQLDAGDELLVEGAKADRQFGDLDVGTFTPANAAGEAPGQELGISRHVGDQVEELPRLERNDTPFLMTGRQEAVSP